VSHSTSTTASCAEANENAYYHENERATISIVTDQSSNGKFSDVIKIGDGKTRSHVDEASWESVEETLNGLLDAEADALCGAERYERSPDRGDTRAGSYTQKLHTKAGEIELKVPRLRKLPFEMQIIEPTILWSGSCERFDVVLGLWARSKTVNRR